MQQNEIVPEPVALQRLPCSPNGSHVYCIKVQRRLINRRCVKLTAAKVTCPLHSANRDRHIRSASDQQTTLPHFAGIFHSSLYTVIIFQIIMCCKVYWPLVNLYLPSWNSKWNSLLISSPLKGEAFEGGPVMFWLCGWLKGADPLF